MDVTDDKIFLKSMASLAVNPFYVDREMDVAYADKITEQKRDIFTIEKEFTRRRPINEEDFADLPDYPVPQSDSYCESLFNGCDCCPERSLEGQDEVSPPLKKVARENEVLE
ncbi:hypothetical protein RCL1_004237 [Eukaryota sp. TZLM3-RCL]